MVKVPIHDLGWEIMYAIIIYDNNSLRYLTLTRSCVRELDEVRVSIVYYFMRVNN